jgi:alkylated DNA repair dioxygenase AlkB
VFLLSHLVSPERVPALARQLTRMQGRLVTFGTSRRYWVERNIPMSHPVSRVMHQPKVERLVGNLTNSRKLRRVAWSNHYGPGQQIPWHVDKSGALQIVLLLSDPGPRQGSLLLQSPTGPRTISLKRGDAVLFDAARLLHRTTPPRGNKSRVTAAMRFFLI